MPAQWTGVLVGKMHNANVTAKQLAEHLKKNPKYISGILNGHYSPAKAEMELNQALDEIIAQRNDSTTNPVP